MRAAARVAAWAAAVRAVRAAQRPARARGVPEGEVLREKIAPQSFQNSHMSIPNEISSLLEPLAHLFAQVLQRACAARSDDPLETLGRARTQHDPPERAARRQPQRRCGRLLVRRAPPQPVRRVGERGWEALALPVRPGGRRLRRAQGRGRGRVRAGAEGASRSSQCNALGCSARGAWCRVQGAPRGVRAAGQA